MERFVLRVPPVTQALYTKAFGYCQTTWQQFRHYRESDDGKLYLQDVFPTGLRVDETF